MNTDLKIRLANINMLSEKLGYAAIKKWPTGMMGSASLLGSALKRPEHVNGVNAKSIITLLHKGVKLNAELEKEIKDVFKCQITDWNIAAILAFRHPKKISQTLPRVGKKATALYAELAHHVGLTDHRTAKTELERPAHFAELLEKRIAKKPAPKTRKPATKKQA